MRVALSVVVLLFVSSCGGGGSTPTQPDPIPSAILQSRGNMTFSACTGFTGCFYEGEATNIGPGCAVNVRGVSRLLDSAGAEIARSDWSLAATRRVNPGEAFLYSGCCFALAAANAPGTYRTDFSFDKVRC